MKNKAKCVSLLLMSGSCLCLYLSSTFAQTPGSSNFTGFPPATGRPMILCPVIKVSVTGNPTIKLNQTSQTIDTGAAVCNSGYSGGGVGLVFGAFAGAFLPDCPPDAPYLGGLVEGWGGVLGVAAGAGMTVTCCSMPQPPMSFTYGSRPSSAGSPYTTWYQGTNCEGAPGPEGLPP